MLLTDDALVLTALPHGEHGAVVRVLTAAHGLRSGYVAGGRGRRLRPVLTPGNRVSAALKARTDALLGTLSVEPVASRALLAFDPAAAAAVDWLTRLTAQTLPEGDAHPALFTALDGVLAAMDGPVAGWAAGVPRYELLLMAELGFGLDLSRCALSGSADGLAFVSPKSGRAVSRDAVAGENWVGKLLPLPAFLLTGGQAAPEDVAGALRLTGHFLPRLPGVEEADLDGARARFIAALQRRAEQEHNKNILPSTRATL